MKPACENSEKVLFLILRWHTGYLKAQSKFSKMTEGQNPTSFEHLS